MRTLITGGAGFIGSNVVDALLDRGNEVVILDNLTTGRLPNLDGALARGATLIELDIRDSAAVLEAFEKHQPASVFHLAAQIDVRLSVADPAFDATVNVAGTANLLEANRLASNARFVLASTGGAIYGEGAGQNLPLDESTPEAPMSPYGQSKLAAEGYLGLFRRLYDANCVALRLGNIYGPRQDPLGEAGVIAIFCGKFLEGGRPTVFGTGEQTRDYVHVSDVVAAMLAASETDAAGPINIGTGVESSVLDLIRILDERAEGDFKPEMAPPRHGEVEQISLDASRAKAELGWTAKVGPEEGLVQTLASLEPVA